MHILIAAVGRAKDGPERVLLESYLARLPWKVTLKEVELKKKELAADVRRKLEGEALLAALLPDTRVIALDERGKNEGSEAFAKRLGQWRDDGTRTIAFIIGGADGLDEAVRKRANAVISFGAVTWPHMLMRALLAEQLFRAHTILTGHPYHRA